MEGLTGLKGPPECILCIQKPDCLILYSNEVQTQVYTHVNEVIPVPMIDYPTCKLVNPPMNSIS